jgi:hypothetical protein
MEVRGEIRVSIAISMGCPRENPPPGKIEKRISFWYGEVMSVETARL